MNGSVFIEVNYEKDAADQVERLNFEVDALIEARQLSVDQLETVARVIFGRGVDTQTTSELRRDILIYAKRDPRGFLNVINDPDLKHNSNIHRFFDSKLLTFRNNNKEVWFNTPTNKKKMISIPYGDDPYVFVSSYLQSDEGLDVLKMLENLMDVE
jgi:hypothetical protein